METSIQKQIILLLLLLHTFRQECNTGCLKCSADNVCQLCDFSKNMYLKEQKCQQGQVSNCTSYSITGDCLTCSKGHFLDTAQLKCVAVNTDQQVSNCDLYLSSTTCLKCSNKFYLSGTVCEAVVDTVENCIAYSGNGICMECEQNYVLSIDNKKCYEIPQVQNCQTYSNIKCLTCQDNLYFQQNAKSILIQSQLKNNNLATAQGAMELFLNKFQTTENSCFATNLENCKILDNFENCGVCVDGYFVKNGSCIQNPQEAIYNCLKYVKIDRCHTCDIGYHLTLDYTCQKNKFIKNCVIFNGRAYDQTECLRCEENFYLIQKNYCQQRENHKIENCSELDSKLDQCGQCNDGFKLTTDGLQCLPIIENCNSYYNSTFNVKQLTCLECIEGYFINEEGQCTTGSISNCKIYQRAVDKCKLCQEKFYLAVDGTCKDHTVIDNCDKYHHLLNKKCEQCSFDTYLLNKATQCTQTTVSNCIKHIRKDYCGQCEELYMLDNGKCLTMSETHPNCLIGEYNVCRKCKDNYVLEKGKCISSFQVVTQNCETGNFKENFTTHTAQCDICKTKTIPYNFKGSYMCIKNTMITSLGWTNNVQDCLSYRLDKDGKLKCTECSNDKKIGLNGDCTTQVCDQQLYSHLLETKKDQVKIVHKNFCKTDNGGLCSKYGVKKTKFSDNKNIEYGCTECKSNNSAFVTLNQTDQVFSYVDNTKFQWKTNSECYANTTLSPNVESSSMTGCEYFYMIRKNTIGCLKCQPGKKGIIKNFMIPHCAEHDSQTQLCIKCQRNYYLDSTKENCIVSQHANSSTGTNLSHMNNCKSMAFDEDKCYECQDGYYLSNDGKTCTSISGTISNCTKYIHNSSSTTAKCAVCENGYTLFNDGANCYQDHTNCLKKATATTCEQCKDNYYIDNTATGGCTQVSNCLLNIKNQNTCLIQYQQFRFLKTNQCQLVNISNCSEYNTDGTCKECSNGFYLIENTCSTINTFKDETSYTNLRNCMEFEVIDSSNTDLDLKYGCNKCKSGYHFKDDNRSRGTYYCIQDGYVQYSNNTPVNQLNLANYSSGECIRFDFSLNKCVLCKSTTHYMSNGICCTEGNQNINGQCASITLSNCLRAEFQDKLHGQNICLKCTATSHVLVDGQCCATATSDYINKSGACAALPTQCKTIDPITKECSECNSGHYLHPQEKFCCAEKSVHISGGTCKLLTHTDYDSVPYITNLRNSVTECLQFDGTTNQCLKCKDGYSFNGKVCQSTTNLFTNCNHIDQQTKLCLECKDGFVNTDINICCDKGKQIDLVNALCITELDHTAIPGCAMHKDNSDNSAYECDKCEEDKVIVDNICCYNYQTVTNGSCVTPSYDNNNCLFSNKTDQQCLLCKLYNQSGLELHLSNNKCCPVKTYNNSGTCTALSDTNCLIPKTDDNTKCQKCNTGYYLNTSEACVALIAQCDTNATDGTCTSCKPGYVLDKTAANCVAIVNHLLIGCKQYDSTLDPSDQCLSCRNGFNETTSTNGKYCCAYNYYFDTDLKKCIKIDDEYCATQNTSKECVDCFQDDNKCIKSSAGVPYFVTKYYLSNKKCVKKGQYYDGNNIIDITMSNCIAIHSDNNKCSECKVNYYLVDGRCEYIKDCNNYVDNSNNKYYLSNNNCCREGTFYDIQQKGCVELTDTNCKQSQDGINCIKCADTYSPQKYQKSYDHLNLAHKVSLAKCNYYKKTFINYACVKTTILEDNNLLKPYQPRQLDNCIRYNSTKQQCEKCIDGYYKINDDDICCQEGKVQLTNKEGYKFCQDISNLKQNCSNYDFENQQCLQCDNNFELSQGRCCASGKYFNEITNTCDITFTNCKEYDSYAKVCLTCKDNHYLTKDICCSEGQVSNDGSTCTAMNDGCLIKDDNGLCHKCSDPKILSFNKCCDANNFYKYQATPACDLINTLGNGYTNCSDVDQYHNCKTCTNSEVLIYGKCCPSNAIWNYDQCTVPLSNSSDNCLKYVQFTPQELAGMTEAATGTFNIKCKECANTHYAINGKCILQNDVYDLENSFGLSTINQKILNLNLDCLEWIDGICNKCISAKILKYDSGENPSTFCVTGSAVNNCHVHKSDITQCEICKDGYYTLDTSGTITCTTSVDDANCKYANQTGCIECNDDYHIDTDDGKCKQMPIQHCKIANGALSECQLCQDGYSLNKTKTKCIQVKTLPSNCSTGQIETDGTFTCLVCIEGYYLDETNSNACTKLTTSIDNCRLHKKITGPTDICQECYDGYRLEHSNALCCHDTEILNTNNECQNVQQFNRNCKTFKIVDDTNINTTSLECLTCNTGYYLIDKTCCKEGTYYDGVECVESQQPATQNCKQYTNNGLCKQIDNNNLNNNCISGYLTNQRCCNEQQYFNIEQQQCINIPNYLSLDSQTCIQIDQDMQCIKCSNMTTGRVYEGYCVSAVNYLELQTMSLIQETSTASSFVNCSVIKDNKCIQCKTGYQLGDDNTSSSKCCWNNNDKLVYNEQQQKCQTLTDINCTTYDFNNKKCTTCISGYFTGTQCCADDKYYKNGSCVDISTIDKPWSKNCKQIIDDDLLKEQCSTCKDSTTMQNGICCAGNFNIDGICYATALECKQMDDNFNCIKCNSGSFLTGNEQKLCCANNKVITFNNTSKEYTCESITASSIEQCAIYETTTKCQSCNPTYHLDDNKCCAIGTYNNNGTCTTQLVPECIEFETKESQIVCKKCKDNFNVIYYKESNVLKSICCENEKTLDFQTKKCVNLSQYKTNCKEVDLQQDDNHIYGLGPQCITPTQGNYISNGVVCADNQYWDGITCNTTIPNTFPNCQRVSNNKCLKCDDTSQRYLIGTQCCSKKYYDNNGTCTDGSSQNCLEFQHECPTDNDDLDINCSNFSIGSICKQCDNGYYLTYAGKCCLLKSFWNSNTTACETYASKSNSSDYRPSLTQCNKFDKNLNCLECATGVLSDDKQSCCTGSIGYVNNTKSCSATHNIPTGCKQYDAIKFECKQCLDNYYLTDQFCCPNGKYFDKNTYTCLTINTTTLNIDSKCNQYKVQGGCVGCSQNYKLNKKEQCIQIPSNCKEFDADLQICFLCNDTYYLTNGVCCLDGNISVNGTCTLIQTQTGISNCKKMQNGRCIECDNNYYERLGYCCQQGYYHDSINSNLHQCIQYPVSGELKDCLQFGVDQHECIKCKQNYVLIKYDTSKTMCQKIQTQTQNTHVNYKCIEYSQSYISNDKGEGLTCTKCDQTGVTGYYKLTNLTSDSYYTETTNEIQKPNNCSIIDLQNKFIDSSLKCLRCESTHYLNTRNECVLRTNTNCQGYVPYNRDVCQKCANGFYLNLRNECKAIPITGCLQYDPVSDLCLQCDTSIVGKNIQLHYEQINNIVVSKCIDIQPYDLTQQSKRIFTGFIDSCDTTDTSQITNKFASNLEYYYDYFYNVHYCSDNKIPVSFIRMGIDQTGMPEGIGYYSKLNNSNVSTYDLDDYYNQQLNGYAEDSGYSTMCINTLRDVFPYFTNDQYGTHLPSNCAMLMVNVSKPLSTTESLKEKPDLSKLSVFCTACKDGYKPLRNSRVPLHVYQCQQITNCTSVTTGPNILNGCSNCSNQYAYGITNDKVDYTRCVATTDTQCLATFSNNKCKFCKQGSILNYDGKCNKITAPHCKDAQFSFTDEFNIKNFGFINNFLDGNKGCINCDDDFVGIYQDQDRLLCASSQTLVEDDFTTDSLIYDAQCKFYGLDNNKTVCKVCNDSYLITQNHKCIAQGDMSNCLIAIATSECYKCKDTHVNVNKKCVEKTIENCKSYISSPSQQTLQCQICEDGFLLNGNVCEEGNVKNCAAYDDRIKCIKCKPNHVLTYMNNLQRCLLIEDNFHPNCKHYNSSQFQENMVVCEQCISDQFIVEDLYRYEDFCIQVPKIENCAQYDKRERLIDSSFKCLQCEDGYRLENNICNFVSDRDPNCEEFQKPGYQCLQCKIGYYLDEQGEKCLQQPLGVQGCAYYKNESTCKFCKTGLYLNKNRCIEISSSNLIEFCKYYQNESVCLQCEDGKILQNNKCLEPIAQCLTYYNINECRSCPEGKGIQIIDGHRACVDITKRDFCAVQKNIDPFECITCTNGYYLNGGACVQISEPIVGCIQYDGDLSCSLCENGLVLAHDKKTCQSIAFNDKCAQYKEQEPFCVYCSKGYTLKDNECIKIENNIPKNCLGVDLNGQCNICLPGHTMNEKYECN